MVLRKMLIKIICFLCLISLFGCKAKTSCTDFTDRQTATNKKSKTNMQTTGKKNETNKQTINKESEISKIRINDTEDGIIVDDLLDCVEMLGKTAAEIGIPSEVINDESKYYIKTYLDGNIFGTEDYGILHFDERGSAKSDYLAKSIWIHVKNVGYDECKIQLSNKFGDPIDEGDNPYVEVDGGAVTWTFYKFQDIEIRLSSASQRDYIEIDIEKLMD